MITHNLCYTTLIPSDQIKNYNESDYTVTPTKDYFIKPHIRKGLLPIILENLLSARK